MERVLLVDHEVGTREALKRHLNTQYEVIHAATGADGLAILRRQRVDVVILEYRLPDVSGLKLLAHIKATWPRLPVVITTAYGSEWVCALALKLGARDYFIKPFDPAELIASIRLIRSTASRENEGRRNVLASNKNVDTVPAYWPTYQPVTDDRDRLAVQQAVRFIQEHYWETISLPQVAWTVGMSKFVLSRKFKAAMQAPFRKYLLRFRVMKARHLLQTNQYSITQVAQMVGFSDLPRFDKVFKQLIGEPPSRYRVRRRGRATNDKLPAINY